MHSLRLPAREQSLEPFRTFVLGALEREAGLENLLFKVDLVVEELLTNIIKYGYPGEPGDIEVECRREGPDGFALIVRDWGVAFNPLDQGEPDLSTDLSQREVGGLGIHLIRHLVRGLGYERREDANVLSVSFAAEE